ncbi:nucleotidyltransferase [bacterium]|nr:nucleotidyltransferase [bacterium]
MNIVIPMAGAGKRFTDAGYRQSKPLIPTTSWRLGRQVPMVVAAALDLPGVSDANLYFIDRIEHKELGIQQEINRFLPRASFTTIDYLTEGQASTCLLTKDKINSDTELLIAGCDNGMILNLADFEAKKKNSDALIFTFRRDPLLLENPKSYGWVQVSETDRVERVSVKTPISKNPFEDHAVVATFWFRRGMDFVRAAEKMISENDRVNGEFYVDQVMNHALDLSLEVRVFEIDKYLGWGTPQAYEQFEATFRYWKGFFEEER